jgi:hypothetical protein
MILLCVGAPCWGISRRRVAYYRSKGLLSVPLRPESDNHTCNFVGDLITADITDPGSHTVSLDLHTSSIIQPGSDQAVYLIHNLWGYSFSVKVYPKQSGTSNEIFSATRSRNTNPDDRSSGKTEMLKEILPKVFFTRKNLWYFCPESTLITRDMGIDSACEAPSGFLSGPVDSKFEMLSLGDIRYEKAGDIANIVFQDLLAIPTDYVAIPQIYWVSFSPSAYRKVEIVGIVFTSIAIAVFVIGNTITIAGTRNSEST